MDKIAAASSKSNSNIYNKGFDLTEFVGVVKGSMVDVLTLLISTHKHDPPIRTIIWMGHGGLDAFMGSLTGVVPKVIVFTCNAKDYELPPNPDHILQQAAQGIQGLKFVVLDTLSPLCEISDTIVQALKTIDMSSALFVHGESGMDIFCTGAFYNDAYSACLDFYEDFTIPLMVRKLYPNKDQYLVVTNPGLDLRKGADQNVFNGALAGFMSPFDNLDQKRYVWTDEQFVSEVTPDHEFGMPMHEIVGLPHFDEWFLGLDLECDFKHALQRLKQQGMRLSVAISHDILYQQENISVPPAYNILKFNFDECVTYLHRFPITPATILEMRTISNATASNFDISNAPLCKLMVEKARHLATQPKKHKAVQELLDLRSKYSEKSEGDPLHHPDSLKIAFYASKIFNIKKFGQNPIPVTFTDFPTKFHLNLLLVSAYPGGGREVGQLAELLLLSQYGSKQLGKILSVPELASEEEF